MKTAAALCLAFGSLCVSAVPELVFQSSATGLRGGTHCNVVMNEAGVLVSSCDFTHGATGFASLQTEVDALKAENAALRSSHASENSALHAAIDALKSTVAGLDTRITNIPKPATGSRACRAHGGPGAGVWYTTCTVEL